MKRFASLILVGMSIFLSPHARAEANLPVAVTVTECAALDSEQLLRLFQVELRERWAQATTRRSFVITLQCTGQNVVVAVAPPDFEQSREAGVRLVPRHEVLGDVGARLLVLQTMELLHEVERDLDGGVRASIDLQADNEEKQSKTRSHQEMAESRVHHRLTTLIGGVEMLSYDLRAPLLGGHVLLDRALLPWIYARVGGSVVTRRAGQGLVTTLSQAGLVRAEVGLRDGTNDQTVGAGLGVRLAFTRITGSSDLEGQQTGSVRSTLWGPYGVAFFDTRLGGSVVSRFSGEVGHTTSRLRGKVSGGEDTLLGGAWVGLSLGLGLKF